jgi:hypothetical protein
MKIEITLREICDKGLWTDFCKLRGWNEWCIAEGLAQSSDTVMLTEAEAIAIGLLK